MLPVAGFKELDPSPRLAEVRQDVPYRAHERPRVASRREYVDDKRQLSYHGFLSLVRSLGSRASAALR